LVLYIDLVLKLPRFVELCGVRFQTFEHGDGRGSMEGSGHESDAIGVELIEECNGGGAHRDADDQRAAVDR
jgi:hypothetical protein